MAKHPWWMKHVSPSRRKKTRKKAAKKPAKRRQEKLRPVYKIRGEKLFAINMSSKPLTVSLQHQRSRGHILSFTIPPSSEMEVCWLM